MAVSNNTLSEIGDVLIIPATSPITGLSTITNYTESVLGVTATRLFTREFRYTIDGVNWTDYIALTAGNLSAIPINWTYDFQIEYKYTRVGTDTTGLLIVNSVNIVATYITYNNGFTYNESVFKYFFDSNHADVLSWAINVLDKAYKQGMISKSLERGINLNANNEDRDYVDFWRTISTYFAYLVKYAREFEGITNNRELLLKYLRHRGLFLCEGTSLADLQYIMKNYWDEMRHRGTLLVTKPKGYLINAIAKPVNGELLRLLCYNSTCDEFLFGISEFNRIGWVGNQWSPLYQGLTDQVQFNKFYEPNKQFTDKTLYPLLNGGNVTAVSGITVPDSIIGSNGSIARISPPPAGQTAGIGGIDFTKAINVSHKLAYELSFYTKSADTSKLTVRLRGYDSTNTAQDLQDVSVIGLTASIDMIVQQQIVGDSTWYLIRCILYPSTHIYDATPSVAKPNIGVGNNLKMTANVCKILPEIVYDNTDSSAVNTLAFWNMRFAPLSTPYSTGFLNTSNVIQTWMQSNGGTYTQDQITEIMKYYLLPYQTTLINNFI
jgi:hypothetical protein